MARILVVDDEDTIRHVLRQLLQSRGHSIEEARDGQAALEFCLREAFDLVITDIRMPRRDGLSLIKGLREYSRNIKMIALTGHDSEALDQAKEAGASYCFHKPFKMDELLEAVEDLVSEEPESPSEAPASRILVIDDDPLIRAALRGILEPVGYSVEEAANGREGIDQNRQCPADLVITNIVMPEMDGLELIRELHAVKPGLPLIAISGYDPKDESGYLALAEEYGALRSFSKPFDRAEVLEAVKEALG